MLGSMATTPHTCQTGSFPKQRIAPSRILASQVPRLKESSMKEAQGYLVAAALQALARDE